MRSPLQVTAVLAILVFSGCSSRANYSLPPSGGLPAGLGRGYLQYAEVVLYNFSSPGYGIDYVSGLTPDGHGDYFGTTEVGGLGYGTVYELTPNGKGGWNEFTRYVFTGGSDGGTPQFTPLVLDKDGNLWGVTLNGGSAGRGVAYKIWRSGGTWKERVIYNFGTDGSVGVSPFSFIAGSAGNFFGTVNLIQGGAWTEGVFELRKSSKGWSAALIFDDGIPSATSGGGGLTIDAKGNIFGVTSLAFQPSEIFKLSPSGNAWASNILYTFPRIDLDPEAPPVLDKMGNIYGATVAGGAKNDGTVYELMPSPSGPWTYKTLYAFTGKPSDGGGPYSSITFDGRGNIYGTTAGGGSSGKGTVYELSALNGRFTSKLLWSFGGKDGRGPMTQVTLDASGDVFGTTTQGGLVGECYAKAGCGNAFEITSHR